MSHADQNVVDEETALLVNYKKQQRPTPLPWLQISIILVLQVCEPLASQSIYPYINQLISELDITGGDERKVGYYAGLIQSLFFITEAVTVLQWSRLSDQIGRKPVLLIGLLGSSLSIIFFGLSRTFWSLVISRCLCGLLNGNTGVMKSVIGELTDTSNRAKGFSLMPVVWSIGATVGPLLGGSLSRPHERFPDVFGGLFWKKYPYLLPCIATAGIISVAFLVTICFFKETVPERPSQHDKRHSTASDTTLDEGMQSKSSHSEPLPFRKLLVYPVILSVSNYMAIAFLNISLNALLPLFLAMPLTIGGLGFTPLNIGYVMSSYGAATGLFQAFFFPTIMRRFGERRVFIAGVSTFLPIFVILPIMSIIAQKHGVSLIVWVFIASVLGMMIIMDMAFGSIFMFVTASAPNKRSLGATHGLSQSCVSVARAIGPGLSTSLFSYSVEHNVLGGYAVYVTLFVLACFAMLLAMQLPEDVWDEESSDSDETVSVGSEE